MRLSHEKTILLFEDVETRTKEHPHGNQWGVIFTGKRDEQTAQVFRNRQHVADVDCKRKNPNLTNARNIVHLTEKSLAKQEEEAS